MQTLTFIFEHYVLRGANEREWPVTGTYQVTPANCFAEATVEVTGATISSATYDVTDAEYEVLEELAWEDAEQAMCDWYSEQADYRAEMLADRIAA